MMRARLQFQLRFAISMLALAFVAASLSGCASFGKTLKSWVGGKPAGEPEIKQVSTPRFSEQENLRVNTDRQYKRMNRQRLEEEAELSADAGSLWVMEGQGAYLFSQNQMRMVGDLLNVRIEGGPRSQLQTKVRVISRLLERLDAPSMRGLASRTQPQTAQNGQQPAAPGANPQAGNNQQNGQEKPDGQPGNGQQESVAAAAAPGEVPFSVPVVPTRIVEQLKDGSYRIRGMQPFMIGKREYKVIVTGIVRPEDFDDAGLDASKLLDPQFDIVSSRKGASL